MDLQRVKPGHRHFKESDITVIYSGVDWLALSTPYMLCDELLAILAEMRESVDRGGDDRKVTIVLELPDENGEIQSRDLVFDLLPGGTSDGFSYRLRNDDLEINARATPVKIDTMPNVRFRARNEFLHRMDWTKAYLLIEEVAQKILAGYGPENELQITRVDLFLDCQGFDLDKFSCRDHMCPPSKTTRADYYAGARSTGFVVKRGVNEQSTPFPDATGFSVGKNLVQLRVYDKLEEIKKSKKEWFFDIYAQHEAYVPGAGVTRVEFEILREKLKALRGPKCPEGIGTVRELVANHSALWRYFCGEGKELYGKKRRGWVTARLPSHYVDKKRWPEHPWWLAVREHAVEVEPLHQIQTVSMREAEAMRPMAEGVLASMAAKIVNHQGGSIEETIEDLKLKENFEHRMPKALTEAILAGWTEREQMTASRTHIERAIRDFVAMGGVKVNYQKIEEWLKE